MAEFDRPSP